MECAPYSKAGGLADVASELPDALAALGHDVVTIAPWHEPAAARPPPLVEAMRMRMPWRCAHGGEEASWIGVSVMRLERMRDRRVELRRRRARKEEEEEEGDRRRHHHHHYYAPLLGARRYLGNAFHRLRRTVWSVLADGGDNNDDDDYGGGGDDDISSERALARRFFVRSPPYARNGAVYGPDSGSDYGDNDLRMLLLCRSALRIPERILFPNNYTDDVSSSTPPSSRIVVVMNDFHAAPAALLMRRREDAAEGAQGHVGLTASAPLPLVEEFSTKFNINMEIVLLMIKMKMEMKKMRFLNLLKTMAQEMR